MTTIKTAKAIRERLHQEFQDAPMEQTQDAQTGGLRRIPSYEEFAALLDAVSDLLTMLDEGARFEAETTVGPTPADLEQRVLALEARTANLAYLAFGGHAAGGPVSPAFRFLSATSPAPEMTAFPSAPAASDEVQP